MSDFRFYPESHRYELDGVELHSVTRMIAEMVDPPKPWWTEEHRIRGQEVHTLTAQYDLGEPLDPELKEKHLGRLNAWMRFRSDTGFKPELIEHRVYNESYRYAGTLDRWGFWHGDRSVILDIKSGEPSWSTSFQLWLYDECLPEKSSEHIAVQLCEDGSWKPHQFGALPDRAWALAMVALYHRKPK